MADLGPEELAVFEKIEESCMKIFQENPTTNVTDIALQMMKLPEVPIHYPYHHYIVPAALLTAAAIDQKMEESRLREFLETARERAVQVPGGCCGNFGACGAGVGTGIFMSVYTESSPVSVKTWGWCNEITGRSLTRIASIPGPRCCKRTCFLALEEAVLYANEHLKTNLTCNTDQKCDFWESNRECKRAKCPYWPGVQEAN